MPQRPAGLHRLARRRAGSSIFHLHLRRLSAFLIQPQFNRLVAATPVRAHDVDPPVVSDIADAQIVRSFRGKNHADPLETLSQFDWEDRPERLRIEPANLESVFLNLTGRHLRD